MRCVHLPVEFENLDSIRLFVRKLTVQAARRHADVRAVELQAPLYAFRLWLDWAISGEECRVLRHVVQDYRAHNWQDEDLTFILEKYCRWEGEPGDLLRCALDAGLIRVERRGELTGLVLADFWPNNEHLSPGYKSIQQKGGMARAEKRQRVLDDEAAGKRREIFRQNGILPFGEEKPTEMEERACYALIIRLDRACGRALRSSVDHSKELMGTALEVVRKFTPEEISSVEEFLLSSREDRTIVKLTERVLPKFGEYLIKSRG